MSIVKKQITAIGLMSGTSLDGLDIACCNFYLDNEHWHYELVAADTISYSTEFASKLKQLTNATALEYAKMHNSFGRYCAEEVTKFIIKNNINAQIIASHGQTIFHNPKEGYTSQIGCGATIAALTGIDTVCDFRTTDVALNGQGAPLVPIADKLLFSNYTACLNLGGFANISFDVNNKRIAFDICPVNTVLNYISTKVGIAYDEGGKMASNGTINASLLKELNELEFYKTAPPKSLGFEWLNEILIPIIELTNDTIENKLRTFCEHIAIMISEIINENIAEKTLLVSGGGAYNTFLMSLIREKSKAKIIVAENTITEFKEAIAFAFLGTLRILENTNTLKSVTGASTNSIGGCVYLSSRRH